MSLQIIYVNLSARFSKEKCSIQYVRHYAKCFRKNVLNLKMIQVILKERDKVDLEKMLFSVPSQL